MNPQKIIILTANPNNTKPLYLSEEVREIKAAWERSLNREKFEIIVEEAVRPRELRRALLTHKPQIIHFSGHGGGEHGLAFLGDSGEALLVKTEALAGFFQALKNVFPIECVLLNACYSEVQAKAIAPYVDYVIGMSQKIGNEAAKEFAIGFYDTLFAGESLENAFALGRNAIAMQNIPEHLTPILKTNPPKNNAIAESPDSQTVPENVIKTITIDFIDGSVPLNSPFYIERNERPLGERECCKNILKSGGLVRIKAPRKTGKTSLMNRILNHARQQGCRTVLINFWNREFLTNINTFLPWFCNNITEELGLEDQLDQHWKKRLGSHRNCANYLTKYILPATDSPLVIALDDIDKIFTYTEIAQDFFGLLRAWHERGKNDKIWQKFRLIIAHSQEVYLNMKAEQSPFNVGLPIELGKFNLTQVNELIHRHQLNFSDAEIQELMTMVNGHPYLLRSALYQIAQEQLTLQEFLKVAPTEEGLFGDFLYSYLLLLENDKSLKMAMKKAINSEQPVKVEATQAFKLRSMGLVESTGNEIQPLCNLYRLYFQEHL